MKYINLYLLGRRQEEKKMIPNGGDGMKKSASGEGQTNVANMFGKEYAFVQADDRSVEEAASDSLGGRRTETFGNRVNCSVVATPAGRPLQRYNSVTELLKALHDVIAGQKQFSSYLSHIQSSTADLFNDKTVTSKHTIYVTNP